MKFSKPTVLFLLLFTAVILYGFIGENPYFMISKKDVELKIPKGFPKPVYSFKNNRLTPEGFVLGRKLFHDPILSRDSSTSCSSCHQRIAAFAHIDHTLSHGINGLIGKRNVPAIQNGIWQSTFMWDGGINHIEVQPLAPITSPHEMDESLPNVILKLQRNPVYAGLFRKAFHDTLVTSERMLKALAQFTGLMISGNSRYDRFSRGVDTLSEAELSGLKLFRNRCGNCHREPLFTDNSFRNIGLKPDSSLKDSGRAAITGIPSDFMKFKVPGLRNVEMTYPYMHDGRFRKLQHVLNHYAEGNFFTTNFDSTVVRNVGLSDKEKSDLIAFLKTLTDREFLYDRRFMDPGFK